MMGNKDIIEVNGFDENPKLITKKVSLSLQKLDFATKRKTVKSKVTDRMIESNTRLSQNLKSLKSVANCQKEKEKIETITCLVKEMENIEYQLKTEKAYLADLKEQIHQTDILKASKIIKGGSATIKHGCLLSRRDGKLTEKSKGVWEGKLHAASVDLSNKIIGNAELREKIRLLMNERKNFNEEYNNLLEKLKNGKVVIEDLVSTVKNAFLVRQTLLKKLEQIDLKAKKQMELQDQEMNDLQIRKESEYMWKHFYLTKSKQRQEAIQKKLRKMTRIVKSKSDEDEKYKLLLKEILQSTSTTGRDSIDFSDSENVIAYIKKDNREVKSLMKYVTKLNNELEVLREQVAKQEREIKETALALEERNFLHKDEMLILDLYKRKIEESKLNFYDHILSNNRQVNKLFRGVENLIDISKADISHLWLLLGENNKVTQFNYKLFLQALETKLISVMGVLNLPRNLVSYLYTKELKPTEVQRNGDFSRISTVVADKVNLNFPCSQCYMLKKSSRTSTQQGHISILGTLQ